MNTVGGCGGGEIEKERKRKRERKKREREEFHSFGKHVEDDRD